VRALSIEPATAEDGRKRGHEPERRRSGRRALLLGLLLALACGVLGHRFWWAREQNHLPLPGNVSTAGPCTVWFVGSSSFGYWDSMGEDLKPWDAVNRGVPGADIPLLLSRWHLQGRFARPPAIVVYAGENDIDRGRSAGRVAADYERLIDTLTQAVPGVPIIAMAVKPSPTRWPEHSIQLALNSQISALTARNSHLHYIDANGQLMSHGVFGPYYRTDGIHLNQDGHRIWAGVIKRELAHYVPGAGERCGG
jgi:lysophospholipase L1-like esterase